MHFVTYAFIAFICLITAILFTEVFPKWFKAILALVGSASSGYALSMLIRKIADWTGAYERPELLMTAGICAVVVLVLIIIVTVILKKKHKA